MSCRIRAALRVLSHIRIGIHAHHIVLPQVGLGEAATERVVGARAIVEQARLAVEALAGEVVVGGHRALAGAPGAVGGEELHGGNAAGAGKRDGRAAQSVGEQVGKRVALPHGNMLVVDSIVSGDGDTALDDRLSGVSK